MGIFVDYPRNSFPSLSKTPTTILTATTNVLWLDSLIICNRGEEDIRFNLQYITTVPANIESNLIYNLKINSYRTANNNPGQLNTLDVVEVGNIKNISLQVGDSLVCYSNGAKQIFDAVVFYSKLNELPLN